MPQQIALDFQAAELRHVVRQMGNLSDGARKRVYFSGLRAAGAVIRSRAKKLAPVYKGRPRRNRKGVVQVPGLLRDSVFVFPHNIRIDGVRVKNGAARVRAGNFVKKRGLRAYHAHLIELGTKERFTRKGARRGRGPKSSYLFRAARETEPQQLAKAATGMQRALDTELRKIARRVR